FEYRRGSRPARSGAAAVSARIATRASPIERPRVPRYETGVAFGLPPAAAVRAALPAVRAALHRVGGHAALTRRSATPRRERLMRSAAIEKVVAAAPRKTRGGSAPGPAIAAAPRPVAAMTADRIAARDDLARRRGEAGVVGGGAGGGGRRGV